MSVHSGLPRPSASSSRARRTQLDFEAALRDPSSTLFLSGGPTLGIDSPAPKRFDSDTSAGDRSFEDDYRMVTPRKNSTAGSSAGVYANIPVTPTSMNSSGSRESQSRSARRPTQSLGIDAEIAQQNNAQSQKSISKRRSLFRSPGTASSPDLATLVKRAKDRKPSDTPPTSSHAVLEKTRSSSISSSGLGTISERRPSDEKSVRYKTKGVLGRMFGSKDQPRAFPIPPEQPVPPIPPEFIDRRSELAAVAELDTRPVTPPSRNRTPSDKPLPSRPPDITPQSHHQRQPASSAPDSPPDRPTKNSFSDDVNGMLADIGHISPARELGLGPESMTDNMRRLSTDRPREHAELGRSDKIPLPAQRTSSLPATSNLLVEINSKRSASSPGLDTPSPSEAGTVRAKHAPQFDSPLAPSVRLVASPVIPSDPLVVSSDEIARSKFVATPESTEDEGRRLACEFLENDFTHVTEGRVAEFLGGPKEVNQVALRYYMQYFSMQGNLVDCFRELCQKLVLRAESQEIDRIIEAFSARYYECNPNTIFGSAGVVHTVTGAMLMLNTDLHIADLNKHMTRSDFIRNALGAIRESMPEDDLPPLRPPTNQRSASAPIVGASSALSRVVSEAGIANGNGSSSTLSSFTYSKAWEVEAENALRDIYNAVRSERILLPSNSNRQSMVSLANSLDSRKPRSPSSGYKRASILGRPPTNSVYSDGRLSPTGSYATSIHDVQPFASIGFASNLSHTVIKEHEEELHSTVSGVSVSTVDDLNDDELALLGAPWAKEGLLERKLYLEEGKRAKKNDWKQFFTVAQSGELHTFVFGSGSGFSGGSVGGGNWLANAKPTGTIDLMHCLATNLPRGANDRQHCFSLTTSTGQVTLFQAGTDDLVAEWVSTCNYWSARRSRHPLVGGVSNMEYGWQRIIGGDLHREQTNDFDDRASVRSARSNLSKLGTYGRKTVQPMDRVFINDWKPPIAASMPSQMGEEQQLEALQSYVASLIGELEQHKAVEEPMMRQFTPGSRNALKARDNWKARSHFIHTEIIKYETYIDSLRSAIKERLRQSGEKKLEKSLATSLAGLELETDSTPPSPSPRRRHF